MNCPKCGEKTTKKGKTQTQKQRYYCKYCNFSFSETGTTEKETASFQQGNDYINIVCSTHRLKTVEDVINHYKIDMDKWKVEKFEIKSQEAWRKDRAVEWDVTEGHVNHGRVLDSGKLLLVPLTHIWVRFAPKTLEDIGPKDITRFFESYTPASFAAKIKPKQYSLSGKALEICLADLHNARQTADENAQSPYIKMQHTINDIVSRAKGKRFSIVYFVPLGDIFDTDNMKRTTTNGTQQIMTMTPYKMYTDTMELFVWSIDKLREIAPVRYVFIPGNHDELISYTLAETLRVYYQKSKDVTFRNDEGKHKWETFGLNLIAWTHGDMPKSNIFSWLQSKARIEWGQTKYSEIHAGHTHTQTVEEKAGQIIRFLPSIADASLWEDGNGYAGNIRSTVSFVWDAAKGLQEQWFTNV